VFALARALLGRGALLVPWIAALFYLVHAGHNASLPIASRRHDALCLALTVWAVSAHLTPAALARMRPRLGALLPALLAMGTKETALVLPAVSATCVFLYSPRAGAVARARHALVASSPEWLVLALALAARFALLRQLGGPEAGSIANLPSILALPGAVLAPIPGMERAPFRAALVAGASLAAVLGLALELGRARESPAPRASLLARTLACSDRNPELRAALAALAWSAAFSLPLAWIGQVRPWRLLFAVAGLAVVFGIAARRLMLELRSGTPVARAVSALALAPLAALLVWHGSFAPPVRDYPEWRLADELLGAYLADLEPRVGGATRGERLRCLPIPERAFVPSDERLLEPPPVILPRSVEAWLALRFPKRPCKVVPLEKLGEQPSDVIAIGYRLDR
jgi:hypothetical protein